MESVFYGFETLNLKTMTNEKIYENVMGHKPNKEFGVKGSFSWDDIDALMNAVKNCSIPAVVGRSEQLVCYICKKNPVEVEDDICKNCADES